MTAGPLLVVCALPPEAWALRGGDWTGADGGHPVLARTGFGRTAARRAAGELLAAPAAYGALVVAGFGAAVGPGTRPGDVVVAEAVRDSEGGSFALEPAAPLVEALHARGLRVHTGLHHTVDHVIRGRERTALHGRGALAVDMEAAAVLAARAELAPRLPAAVLRVVVDTPEHELLRPGTLLAGLRAWRALRALVPALTAWHRCAAAAPTHAHPSTLPQEAS